MLDYVYDREKQHMGRIYINMCFLGLYVQKYFTNNDAQLKRFRDHCYSKTSVFDSIQCY